MKIDVEQLAREAGETPGGDMQRDKVFAALVLDRAAVVCDELPAPASCSGVEKSLWHVATMAAGDAVRAMKPTEEE